MSIIYFSLNTTIPIKETRTFPGRLWANLRIMGKHPDSFSSDWRSIFPLTLFIGYICCLSCLGRNRYTFTKENRFYIRNAIADLSSAWEIIKVHIAYFLRPSKQKQHIDISFLFLHPFFFLIRVKMFVYKKQYYFDAQRTEYPSVCILFRGRNVTLDKYCLMELIERAWGRPRPSVPVLPGRPFTSLESLLKVCRTSGHADIAPR